MPPNSEHEIPCEFDVLYPGKLLCHGWGFQVAPQSRNTCPASSDQFNKYGLPVCLPQKCIVIQKEEDKVIGYMTVCKDLCDRSECTVTGPNAVAQRLVINIAVGHDNV